MSCEQLAVNRLEHCEVMNISLVEDEEEQEVLWRQVLMKEKLII
jgi:hypothetical protein